jgi:pyridoxine 5-phosphate synthase
MACTPEILRIALKTRPEQVTLVPEKRAEITTEGGLDVARAQPSLARDITRLKKEGILVSLFVDAELDQVRASARQGADAVELHTGPYANARSESAQMRHVERLLQAAEEATRLGLRVNAGHGLTYANVRRLVGALQVEELHIGHSLIARAVMVGMERAAREMCELIARYSKKV